MLPGSAIVLFMRNDELVRWQVQVEHPDTDAVFTVLAVSEAEAVRLAEGVGVERIGEGAVATWVCAL